MSEKALFQVDVEQIIRAKAPGKSKRIPRFIFKLLARLICQDGLNDFLNYNNNATGVDFMKNAVRYFDIKLKCVGDENIPNGNNKFIFASNHPLGGLDGICLSAFLGEKYKNKVKYLVNDLLYFIEPLQNIFVPVNKHGAQGKQGAESINDAFNSDNQIITFPAGLCSRKQNGQISDLEWKKMFIIKSIAYKRDIIPVYFEAKNSRFFYWFENFRKAIGIKINLEMLLLPREMFKSKGSTFTIYFGKPIPWQTFDFHKSPQEWAREVKRTVYEMVK